MDSVPAFSALFGILFALFVLIIVFRSIRIVGQGETFVVERLGRYNRTMTPGLSLLIPFVDRVHQKIDMREQVVSFPPQPVITQDNLVVSIDSVIYFTVTDSQRAAYEMANPLMGIEQLTVTTLRNVIGSLDLEATLTSRDEINSRLRAVLDEATGQWGIRVNRVELKAIDPPASVQEAMEKQMRAERERRAVILTAEGEKGSAILSAEGAQQAAVLRAEGDKQAAILRAEGEAQALNTVVQMIHESGVDQTVLAYQYLKTLPAIANGSASKVWVIPAELSKAVGLLGEAFAPHKDVPPNPARG
ncbi:MAG: SPFH domain-containing protein [Actinomycetota bacterium]|nr:SPFH domain-containing protein [Actinomycetota bacterium]